MRLLQAIARPALGLVLSTTLLACASGPKAPAEPVVVVHTVRDTPPAELTRCPALPRGLPTTGEAVIPPEWRAGIGRLAVSHGALLAQLYRLIAWNTGEPCPSAPAEDPPASHGESQ